MKAGHSSAEREVRRVLEIEAKTLLAVRRVVGPEYSKAVSLLSRCRGKIIVTGVGKSGLVAQKIAATFSSTGAPAVFLDPTQALHGGLGLIQALDVVVAIGKSGESDELNALLPHLSRRRAKIVAITANPRSTLARQASIVLETPIAEEACPLNLAPTSSTTAALAVGDALAVALMKVRNFKAEHFAFNHPAGRLGRRLTLKVKDIMRSGEDNPRVPVSAGVGELLIEMTRKQAGAASIVDGSGRLVGLVTDYDIRKAIQKSPNLMRLKITAIMNPKPTTVRADESALKAVSIMENRKQPFNVLPVIDGRRRSVGMIQVHDLRARGL